MNFLRQILWIAVVVIIPLNIDIYATTLGDKIEAEKGKQPEFATPLIARINGISSNEFVTEIEKIISYNILKLIERLVTNINSGIETGRKVNLKFLQDIANALQKGKGNATYAEFHNQLKNYKQIKMR